MIQFEMKLLKSRWSTLVLSLAFCAFVTGCSLEDNGSSRKYDSSNARRAKVETVGGIDQLRELSKPPGLTEKDKISVSASKAKGLNLEPQTTLFSESIRDSDERFDRLEEAVQEIRNEFDSIKPAISRLVATEEDIQDLLAQLKTLLAEDTAIPAAAVPPPVVTSAPTPITPAVTPDNSAKTVAVKKTVTTTTTKAAQPSIGQAHIRAADHADKTRIVLESPSKRSYAVNFDSGEQLILIESSFKPSLDNLSRIKRHSKRILDINVEDNDDGNYLIIIAMQNINSISSGVHLSPNSDNGNYRFFFDAKP